MLTTVICLIYVGLIVAVAALPAHKYSMHLFDPNIPFPRFEVAIAIILTFILNMVAMIVPLNLGLSSLRKRDY